MARAVEELDAEALLADLDTARRQTLMLVRDLDDEQLRRVHSPLMSPLAWDLAHIGAYEDLWLAHRHGGCELLRPDLTSAYDAFETPRAQRGALEALTPAESRAYLDAVRERVRRLARQAGVGDGTLFELVAGHERQHQETMLQTLNLARPEHWSPPGSVSPPVRERAAWPSGLELVEVPGGAFTMGAPAHGFAYDNERPPHEVDLAPFRIGRTAVTNGDWLCFIEAGGYERREVWSEAGWRWRLAEAAAHPLNWIVDPLGGFREWRLTGGEALDHAKPVVHVSWWEADAFARAHGLRLPTEAEWEKAATWDFELGRKRRYPWGDGEPTGERCNLIEGRLFGTAPADAHPAGRASCGADGMIGDVWEWTASCFAPYPGFRAHPYREYSEVFFGDAYRVLRGGSWASSSQVVTPTFRNWDLPQRRQIFAGLRLAGDG